MLEGIFSAFFAWAWTSVWAWLGFGGALIVGLLVLAWFIPQWRPALLGLATAVFAVLAAYTKGSADASRRKDAQRARDEAEAARLSRKARADAERDIDADPDGVRTDPLNRDN